MDNTPENERASQNPYQGYGAQPYGAEEMPQTRYPEPEPTPYYTPGEQSYTPPASAGPAYGSEQPGNGQQQQQQSYGQQQQYGQQGFRWYQPYGQSMPGDVGPFERTGMGMKARLAGLLCYAFGWVSGLAFLFLERENRFVRFHAMQSLLFFGILNVASWAFGIMHLGFLSGPIGVIMFVGWIFLMVTANRGRYYKIPIIGDLAEQFLTQFR